MPQPHLFKLFAPRAPKGAFVPLRGRVPLPVFPLGITGVTKDSTGAVLGSCVVQLFRTDNDQIIEEVVSDATTGVYILRGVAPGVPHYVVAYKAGSPDVAGTTVNTLVGA